MHSLDGATREFVDALLRLDREGVKALLAGLRPDGGNGRPTPEEVMVPALEQIGRAWEEGRLALSQVYMAGRICEIAVAEVLTANRAGAMAQPRLAIAVLQDHHALGKRMVKSALHAAGFYPRDYGLGRAPADLVELAQRDRLDVLLISCLMLAAAVRVEEVTAGLTRAGLPTLVVVGGAPFRLAPLLWREVGARAMGRNSSEAVSIAHTLTKEMAWA